MIIARCLLNGKKTSGDKSAGYVAALKDDTPAEASVTSTY
jgi:hypothetical protein